MTWISQSNRVTSPQLCLHASLGDTGNKRARGDTETSPPTPHSWGHQRHVQRLNWALSWLDLLTAPSDQRRNTGRCGSFTTLLHYCLLFQAVPLKRYDSTFWTTPHSALRLHLGSSLSASVPFDESHTPQQICCCFIFYLQFDSQPHEREAGPQRWCPGCEWRQAPARQGGGSQIKHTSCANGKTTPCLSPPFSHSPVSVVCSPATLNPWTFTAGGMSSMRLSVCQEKAVLTGKLPQPWMGPNTQLYQLNIKGTENQQRTFKKNLQQYPLR